MKNRVLIVDDEERILTLMERALSKKKRLCIKKTTCPYSALELIQSGTIDLLLTDIMMPEMNGIVLSQKALQSYPDLKIMVMTADSSMEKLLECERLGVVDYITKPFLSMSDVESRISHHLLLESH